MRSIGAYPFLLMFILSVAGCATTAPTQGALSPTRAAQLERGQAELAREVQNLRDSVLVLEGWLREQQQLTEELRRTLVAQNVTSLGDKAVGAPPVPTPDAPQTSPPAAGGPTEIYLQAFANYASERFAEAARGFETFLRLFPASDHAGNAQYWLGECYYALGEYPQAAAAFRKVSEQYPQGSKTPDALLKMAEALNRMQEPEQAREALRILQERYPGSTAARTLMESR